METYRIDVKYPHQEYKIILPELLDDRVDDLSVFLNALLKDITNSEVELDHIIYKCGAPYEIELKSKSCLKWTIKDGYDLYFIVYSNQNRIFYV